MKNLISILAIFMVLFVFALLPGFSAYSNHKAETMKNDSSSMDPEVYKIVSNSCFACHGKDGKSMALAHVKMQEWEKYSADKQADKAEAMCNMVKKGKMPPKGYVKDHPEAALTDAQIATICKWSEALNSGKK
jgi:mono/diheme cytochrome c family protein